MGDPLQEEALSLHPMRTAFLAYYRSIVMGQRTNPDRAQSPKSIRSSRKRRTPQSLNRIDAGNRNDCICFYQSLAAGHERQCSIWRVTDLS
jgi:hypothetical protein